MTMADTQTVRIDKLVYGGDGLARLDSGEVVFVPFVAPGESAQITLENPAQKIKHGTVCALEEASSERVKPPCSVFGECGGCQWQHLSATAQADWKRQIVEESLVRIGKLKSVVVNPAITPPDESARWHYRNKAEWIVSRENPEQPRLAYARLKSHDPVAFDHCWIIPEAMNQLARALETSPGILAQTERVTVRSNTQEELLIQLKGPASLAKEIAASVRRWQEGCPSLQHVLLSTDKGSEAITGEPCLIESTENLRFQVSANSFFQVNPVVSSRMLAFVRSLLPERVESLLDIYAGVGFFSFGLSQAAREVFAVESGASAITDFETNRELNQIEHVRMLPGLAEKVLPGLERNFETALLDPPRAGCPAPVLEWLSGHVQRQIIYISCDPTTLARDLQKLAQQGWRIDCVQPFDMFPQTYHIETVVSLSRA